LAGPREALWLDSPGQIDLYDPPALVNAAADAITAFAQRLPATVPAPTLP
jgi:hypothetical protein